MARYKVNSPIKYLASGPYALPGNELTSEDLPELSKKDVETLIASGALEPVAAAAPAKPARAKGKKKPADDGADDQPDAGAGGQGDQGGE